ADPPGPDAHPARASGGVPPPRPIHPEERSARAAPAGSVVPGRPAEAPGTTPARARARPATAAVSYAKDHDMLIKAWAHVAARHPDRAQRIVGGHESGAPGHRNRAECETRITGHAYRIPGREDSPHRTGRSSPEENRHG